MHYSDQIQIVNSYQDLITTPFSGIVNALGWIRNLEGDFKEIVDLIPLTDTVTEISIDELQGLTLSPLGQKARTIILEDYKNLEALGAQPQLNLISAYPRDTEFDFITTDVYSYHVDGSDIASDTFLCTYHGACSDILPNKYALPIAEDPIIRKELEKLYDPGSGRFEEFLKENYFDLHYIATQPNQEIPLGIGNLWRLATDHPQKKVPACVHRAPMENPGELRLLLIC